MNTSTVKIHRIQIVIMFVSLAVGASFGYLYGVAVSQSPARTIVRTTTATTTATSTIRATTSTTITVTPTLSADELSGALLVSVGNRVYRLNMNEPLDFWQLVATLPTNESVTRDQISPDGRYLAYNIPESGIHIMDLSTGESHILLKHAGLTQISCLSWSPDGTRISYRSCPRVAAGKGGCRLVDYTQGYYYSHSSNWEYGGIDVDGIYVLDLSGRTQLIDKPRPSEMYLRDGKHVQVTGALSCPVWTGANTLIFERFTGLQWPEYIFLQDYVWPDTTTVGSLTSTGVRLRNLSKEWYAHYALTASSDTVLLSNSLPVVVRSSDLERLGKPPTTPGFCVHFNATADTKYNTCEVTHFSPDGKRMAFLVQSSQIQERSIVLVDTATPDRNYTTVPLGNGHVRDFVWSPNGTDIALSHDDFVSIMDLGTGVEKKILAGSPLLWMYRTAWSLDGNYVVVFAVPREDAPRNTGSVLCVVRVSDSAYLRLPRIPSEISWRELSLIENYPEINPQLAHLMVMYWIGG
jgi:WD40 repeat protein